MGKHSKYGTGQQIGIEQITRKGTVVKFKILNGLFQDVVYTVDLATLRMTDHPRQGKHFIFDMDLVNPLDYEKRVRQLLENMISQDLLGRIKRRIEMEKE